MSNFAGFQSVKLERPKKSTFDLTHDKRLTTQSGVLTPVLVQECVPSDYFRGSSEMLLRLAPMLAPIYDQVTVYVHFFFVPNRLLWEDWEEFITGGRLGVGIDPAVAPVPPHINVGSVMESSGQSFAFPSTLGDYLGLPVFVELDVNPTNWLDCTIDIMPFAAYQLIWYEYYRDRNFVSDEVFELPLPSGLYETAEFIASMNPLRQRNYAHDYFTSALPFTQRGEEVLMPLAGVGTVTYRPQTYVNGQDGDPLDGGGNYILGTQAVTGETIIDGSASTNGPGVIDNIESVIMNESSVSINDFRSAYALQVWLERNAIGGSRYTESTQAHFGVKPQDSRLQRPEYIGGGRIPVKISEVVSTAWSTSPDGSVPLANMGGHGVTYGDTNQFNYFCTEHGFIMGILSIMTPPSYMQGLPRMFKRSTFLDYPWPTFTKLGEQEVHDFEIYCNPTALTPNPTTGEYPLFGYQSRYADWKYMCTTNHGSFKDTLVFWTAVRIFADTPVLSQGFNEYDSSTMNRMFAVDPTEGTNPFWIYIHNKITVKRPLPYFGTPNTLGF